MKKGLQTFFSVFLSKLLRLAGYGEGVKIDHLRVFKNWTAQRGRNRGSAVFSTVTGLLSVIKRPFKRGRTERRTGIS